MKLVVSPLVYLSEVTRAKLYKLTTRGDSVFKHNLMYAANSIFHHLTQKKPLNTRIIAILAKEDKTVLGWTCFNIWPEWKIKAIKRRKIKTVRWLGMGIFVSPKYRGLGVSKKLMRATEKYAREHGYDALNGRPYNERGVAFFRACGFFIEKEGRNSYQAFKMLVKDHK